MEGQFTEWLNLVFRWFHIIAGIAWIGSSFFFMWLDSHLEKLQDSPNPHHQGELWMVHSGGFYQVEKTRVVPVPILDQLHWFKWEAALTWISGFCLLLIVYYMGGGVLLLSPDSPVGTTGASLIGIGSLVIGWFIYDLLWMSPLARQRLVAAAISFGLLVVVAYGLSRTLSGRAAYIHVGAMLGTLMAANVWRRILPAQTGLISATREGGNPNPALAARAKERSTHNNIMTFPVIFMMISNHYPSTYGHVTNWLILILLVVAGAGVRLLMNTQGKKNLATVAVVVAALAGLAVVQLEPELDQEEAEVVTEVAAETIARQPIDPDTVGAVKGVVRFDGPPPNPKELTLVGSCAAQSEVATYEPRLKVTAGKLANAFVWIREGTESFEIPPAPQHSVLMDQKGCQYNPLVVGVRVGQPITFLNSDPVFHNVHVIGKTNRGFNLSMPMKDMKATKKLKRPEVMVRVTCDAHPWMNASIGVVAHPYFAVTATDGKYAIEGLPPGKYVLEVWHDVLGTQTQSINVPVASEIVQDFSFAPKPE
jgi:uncharacterized membrane protein/plastocyanin